jgi:hypothetical protein
LSDDENSIVKFRADQAFIKSIDDDQKQRGLKDRTEYLKSAILHFQRCKETESNQAMRMIVTKFDGHCLKCNEKVPAGSWALYGKGVGLYCLDCYVQKMGDKTLVAKYLKNRELDQVSNALRKEADALAEKIEAYRGIDRQEALTTQQEKISTMVQDYLTHNIVTPQEKEALENIIRETEQGKRLHRDIEDFIRKYMNTKRWRKKLQQTEQTEDSQAQ